MKRKDIEDYEQTEYSGEINGDEICLNLRKYHYPSNSGSFRFKKEFQSSFPAIELWATYEFVEHPDGSLQMIAHEDHQDYERFNLVNLRIWNISDKEIEVEYGAMGRCNLKRV